MLTTPRRKESLERFQQGSIQELAVSRELGNDGGFP
jgi:hypothetical protein